MKKWKRIITLAGAVLLVIMYGCTLILALTDQSETMGLFKASVACTIIIPVLLYAYTLVYRLTRHDKDDDDTT